MECKVANNELTRSINNALDNWLEELGSEGYVLKKGETYAFASDDIKFLKDFFDTKVKDRFGEKFVGEVDLFDYPSGKNFNSIVISPNYSKLLADHLVDSANGKASVLDKNEGGVANARKLLNDSITKEFDKRQDNLQSFLGQATESLKKLTRIKDIKSFIQENAITEGNLYDELRKLYTSTYSNLLDDDFNKKVKALGNYLLEADVKTKAYYDFVQNEDNLVKLNEIYTLTKGYMPLFNELHTFTSKYNVKNELSEIIGKTKNRLDAIEKIHLNKASDIVSAELMDVAFKHPRRMKNIQRKRTAIERFEKSVAENKLLGTTRALKSVERSMAKIEKLKKDIENLDITTDKLKGYIKGEHGDINIFSSLIMSASSNADLIISGMGDLFRKHMGDLNTKRLIPISNRFFQMMDDYGGNIVSPEKHFKKFVKRRVSHFFNTDEEKMDSKEILEILHDVDPAFYTMREEKEAKVKEASHFLRKYDENSQEYSDWRKEKDRRLEDLRKFYDENQERKYSKEYYDTRERHKDEVIAFKAKYTKYIDKYKFDIDKIYDDLREEKIAIYNESILLGKFKIQTPEQKDRLAAIRRDEKRIRSVEYIKATMEDNIHRDVRIELAELLSRQRRDESEYIEYKETDEGKQAWENDMSALAKLKLELTEEQYNSLKATMVDYVYPPEFVDTLNGLLNEKTDLLKSLTDITNYETPEAIANAWTEIKDTALPYRDGQGTIEGFRLNATELKKITDKQKFVFGENNSMLDILGVRQERERIDKEIENELAIMKGGGSSNSKKLAYENLKLLVEKKKTLLEESAKQYGVESILDRLKGINEELSELIEREPTEYYKDEYDRQMDMWIQKNPLTETSFEDNGAYYSIIENQWHISEDKEDWQLLPGDIGNVWRSKNESSFQDSEWFQNNHIKKEYFDKELGFKVSKYEASYTWMKTFPKDKEKYRLQEIPSFKYKTREVKKEYLTKNEPDGFTNRARPKGWANKEFSDLQGSKDGDLLNKLLSEYKGAQDLYPPGKRLGYRIPSIARKNNIINIFTNPELRNKKIQHQLLLRDVETTEDDIDTGEALADTAGVEVRELPHHYASRMDADIISTDIVSSIMKYSMAANKMQYIRNEMLPTATSLLDVMAKNTPTTNKKDKVWSSIYSKLDQEFVNRMGLKGLSKKRHNENNRLAIMSEFVDTFYYGRDIVDSKGGTFKLGKTTIRTDKVLSKLRGYKSFLTMAALPSPFIIAGQMANVANGMFNQLIHTLVRDGHAKFTFKQWVKAHYDYGKYSVGFSSVFSKGSEGTLMGDYFNGRTGETQSKFGKMMDYFQVLEGRVEDQNFEKMRDKNILRKVAKGDMLFFVRQSAELRLYGTTFLAYMKSQQVKINGEEATLWDAYDGTSLKPGTTIDGQPVDEGQVRADVQRLLRITQGNYAKYDKTLLENRWYGPGIMYMKKFWVEFYMARYGSNRFNIDAQDMIEGYWRTTFKNLSVIIDNPLNWGKNFKDLSQAEQTAVKQAGLELAFIVAMGGASSLLFGYDEKDEDRFKKMEDRHDAIDWALYFTMKTKSEMESMTLFGGLDETIKAGKSSFEGILPYSGEVLGILRDDLKRYGPVPIGVNETKRDQYGYEEGTNKLYIRAIKLLSITKPSRFSAEETIRNYEKSKRR